MRLNDVEFPHPVLGMGDSIQSVIKKTTPNIQMALSDYNISFTCEHDNKDINVLLSSGKAEFVCEVTCSDTVYRSIFKGQTGDFNFSIPRKSLKNKVSFSCWIVAKQPISSYTNSDAHPDYEGFKFSIDKGDVLALMLKFEFDASIKYEKLTAVATIMEVVEGDDLDFMTIDLSEAKILIKLPSSQYKVFAKEFIAKNTDFVPILHSSIVLNALIFALFNIGEYEDRHWAKAINYRLTNEFQELSVEDRENIPEIAQRLLGNPIERLIEKLPELNEVFIDDNN